MLIYSHALTAVEIKELSLALVRYYTDAGCTQPASGLLGVIGQCEQLSAPLVSTKIICP